MALEVVLQELCVLLLLEVYPVALELALQLCLTLDDIFLAVLFLEP